MLRTTTSSCPRCREPLEITWDMWGQFYVCRDCGFTAEDDEELERGQKLTPPPPPWLRDYERALPWQVLAAKPETRKVVAR